LHPLIETAAVLFTRGYGEIGRHARLRIWCRKVCRFESYYPHLKFA